MYTYHKYHKSINSQVPLDSDGNPISDDDPEGSGVALDLGHIHENARFSAEEERPLASSSPLSSGRRGAHSAVRAPLFRVMALHKAESVECRALAIRQVTARFCLPWMMRKTVGSLEKPGKDGQINWTTAGLRRSLM